MPFPIIDAHIHLDQYSQIDQTKIIKELIQYHIKALIAVSTNLASAKQIKSLATAHKEVKPVYGYHPEQELPGEQELQQLINFLEEQKETMVAIGEVGLPYYLRQENRLLKVEPYIELLESFIIRAKNFQKPLVLHAVYGDAPIVCHLLEKHSVKLAHFHWFKGDKKTIERMIANDYCISVTPDILYKERTRNLVAVYPLHLIMVETDGPWQFSKEKTHPKMIHFTMREIAKIKKLPIKEVYETIFTTTERFYSL